MNATIRQQRGLAAGREHNALSAGQARRYAQVQDTAGQCRAVEREWAHTPVEIEVEGESQMEMSAPEPAVRIIEGIIAVLLIAIGWSGVSWLRHGGMDLIAGWVW